MSNSHFWFQKNKLDKYFDLRVANMLPEQAATTIFSKLPDNEVFEQSQLPEYIKTDIGITDEGLIQQAIDVFVNRKQLVMVDHKGSLYSVSSNSVVIIRHR